MKLGKSSLDDIAKLVPDYVKRKRISSYDRSWANKDWIIIKPRETAILGEVKGAGCIKHIWCTYACLSKHSLRNAILRMYWDGELEDKPSVETPLGDFFGMGHAKHKNFVSLPLQMSPRGGKGFNCWWPMPFSSGFKITLENDNDSKLKLFYYLDYELFEDKFENEADFGRFHAQWRRENPPNVKKRDSETGKRITRLRPKKFTFSGKNTEPLKYNYRILEAKGKGQYVGCNLNIYNKTFIPLFFFPNWPGEGDDMIFIDDDIEKGVPTLCGTGTEDYVCQAWSQQKKYFAPYFGTIKGGGLNWHGKITYYRYHIEDPIYFNKQIIVSIEHGHDNHRKDDWSSTAYWYQKEPHEQSLIPKLLDKKGRKPINISWKHTIRKTLLIALIAFLIYIFAF
jgi:hypothetical protein